MDFGIIDAPQFDYVNKGNPTIDVNPRTLYATWLNLTTGELFICINNSINTNVWSGMFSTVVPDFTNIPWTFQVFGTGDYTVNDFSSIELNPANNTTSAVTMFLDGNFTYLEVEANLSSLGVENKYFDISLGDGPDESITDYWHMYPTNGYVIMTQDENDDNGIRFFRVTDGVAFLVGEIATTTLGSVKFKIEVIDGSIYAYSDDTLIGSELIPFQEKSFGAHITQGSYVTGPGSDAIVTNVTIKPLGTMSV